MAGYACTADASSRFEACVCNRKCHPHTADKLFQARIIHDTSTTSGDSRIFSAPDAARGLLSGNRLYAILYLRYQRYCSSAFAFFGAFFGWLHSQMKRRRTNRDNRRGFPPPGFRSYERRKYGILPASFCQVAAHTICASRRCQKPQATHFNLCISRLPFRSRCVYEYGACSNSGSAPE